TRLFCERDSRHGLRRCGNERKQPWRRWPRNSAPSVGRRSLEHRSDRALRTMTTPAIAFLVVAGLFAVGDWVARARKNAVLEYVCKPATLVALIATAVALMPVHDAGARRVWF